MSFRALFGIREFSVLLFAHFCVTISSTAFASGLSFLVYRDSGSGAAAALAFAGPYVSYALCWALIPMLLTAYRPRALLCFCALIAAVVAAVGGLVSVGVLSSFSAFLSVFFGLAPTVFAGVRSALIPRLVDPSLIVLARSSVRAVSQGVGLIGAALGPLAVQYAGGGAFLWSLSLLCLCAALATRLGVASRPPLIVSRESLSTKVAGGFEDRRVRRVVLMSWALPCVAVASECLLVDVLPGGRNHGLGYGICLACLPIGLLVGDAAVARYASPQRLISLPSSLAPLVGAGIFIVALSGSVWVSAIGMTLIGIGLAVGPSFDYMLLHSRAPEASVTRAFAVSGVGVMAVQGAAIYLWAGAAWLVGSVCSLIVAGLLGVCLSRVFYINRQIV